jgi:hypothetical protein
MVAAIEAGDQHQPHRQPCWETHIATAYNSRATCLIMKVKQAIVVFLILRTSAPLEHVHFLRANLRAPITSVSRTQPLAIRIFRSVQPVLSTTSMNNRQLSTHTPLTLEVCRFTVFFHWTTDFLSFYVCLEREFAPKANMECITRIGIGCSTCVLFCLMLWSAFLWSGESRPL